MLHVPVTYKNGGRRKFRSLLHKCLLQQLLSFFTVVYIQIQPPNDLIISRRLIGNIKKLSRRLSIPDNEIVVLYLRFCAAPRQQQSFTSFGKSPRRQFMLGHAWNHRRLPKPDVYTSQSSCHPHSAPITLQILHHQLSHRIVPSSFNFLAASVPLLVSSMDDEIPECSTFLSS